RRDGWLDGPRACGTWCSTGAGGRLRVAATTGRRRPVGRGNARPRRDADDAAAPTPRRTKPPGPTGPWGFCYAPEAGSSRLHLRWPPLSVLGFGWIATRDPSKAPELLKALGA